MTAPLVAVSVFLLANYILNPRPLPMTFMVWRFEQMPFNGHAHILKPDGSRDDSWFPINCGWCGRQVSAAVVPKGLMLMELLLDGFNA